MILILNNVAEAGYLEIKNRSNLTKKKQFILRVFGVSTSKGFVGGLSLFEVFLIGSCEQLKSRYSRYIVCVETSWGSGS